jgi:hypothetical protein
VHKNPSALELPQVWKKIKLTDSDIQKMIDTNAPTIDQDNFWVGTVNRGNKIVASGLVGVMNRDSSGKNQQFFTLPNSNKFVKNITLF